MKTIREQASDQLKIFYETCIAQKRFVTGYDYNSWNALDNEFKEDILQVINYMRDAGWITYITDKTQCPMNIKLTPEGIDIVENNSATAQVNQTTFNIATNYGVAASTASHFTITVGASIADIEKLIEEKIANTQEKDSVKNAIHELGKIIESQKPIEHGGLSAISPYLQKHSWLTGPVAALLLHYATALVK